MDKKCIPSLLMASLSVLYKHKHICTHILHNKHRNPKRLVSNLCCLSAWPLCNCLATHWLTDWSSQLSGPPWDSFFRRVSAWILPVIVLTDFHSSWRGSKLYDVIILLCCIIIVYIVEKQTWFLSDFRPHTRVEKWIQWLVMLIKILFLKPGF